MRDSRLAVVEEKVDITKRKIVEQGRMGLQTLAELERLTFVRECIDRRIFNWLSVKHPEYTIPDFKEVFDRELASCGLSVAVTRISEPATVYPHAT